tara:strand:+ start:2297 stop:5728 length:3432 start_codon:yes stop_codon:yes gene_type:complete
MKEFPRIYSLSTVGIIFHLHNDYLLHPLRTDFTGESGIGKSLIADFLQLIFIAKKGGKYYRPGTESSGDIGRNVENLVLQSFGYIFLTVQKTQDEFLTIGIYLQKSSKSITPFVIQKGINWSRESEFDYNDKILLSRDFLDENGAIHEIKYLRKSVLKPRGHILEMFNGAKVSLYHHLLFYNKILPIDLSQQEDKLLTYAQIIQSFSRAKSLKMDKLALKNFLFADDKTIHDEYSAHIRKLEEYQRNYIESGRILGSTEKRFSVLKEFRSAFKAHNDLKIDLLKSKASFRHENLNKAKSHHFELTELVVINSLAVNQIKQNSLKEGAKKVDKELKKKRRELEHLQNQKRNLPTEIERDKETLQENMKRLDKTKDEVFKLKKIIELIETGESLASRYGSLENVRSIFLEQSEKAQLISDLILFETKLIQEGLTECFEDSIFLSAPFDDAIIQVIAQRDKLKVRIESYKKLQSLLSEQNPSSLFNWLRNQDHGLTWEQESVFIHFCNLATIPQSRPDPCDRYIENPDLLFRNMEYSPEGSGLWLSLHGVNEFIAKTEQRMFGSLDQIKVGLESLHEKYENKLNIIEKEYTFISRLISLIHSIPAVSKAIPNYKNRLSLKEWTKDDQLELVDDLDILLSTYNLREEHYRQFKKAIQNEEILQKNCFTTESNLNRKIAENQGISSSINDLRASLDKVEKEGINYLNQLRTREADAISIKSKYHSIDLSSLENRIRETKSSIYQATDLDNEVEILNKKIGTLDQELRDLNDSNKPFSITQLNKEFQEAAIQFREEIKREFDAEKDKLSFVLNDQILEEKATKVSDQFNKLKSIRDYQIIDFDPTNNRLKESFDYIVLSQELLPQIFSGVNPSDWEEIELQVTQHLNSIRESMSEINEHKLRLIGDIFGKVESAYDRYELKVMEIKSFFKEQEITGGLKIKFDFQPSEHYPIKWIQILKKSIRTQANFITPIFEASAEEKITAEEIIIKTFQKCASSNVTPEIKRLTNPKSYFDIEANLTRMDGEKIDGSSGQDYAKIALLCIARLSKIEEDSNKVKKKREGLRFMAIDEVAGLGGNFDLLYDIAKKYDYQIITMTVEPSLSVNDNKQFSYILNMGKQTKKEKINPPPFGMFSLDNLERNVKAYIEAQV